MRQNSDVCICIRQIFLNNILFVFGWYISKPNIFVFIFGWYFKPKYYSYSFEVWLKAHIKDPVHTLDAIFPSQTIARECKDKPHDNIQNVHSQLVNMWNIHYTCCTYVNIEMAMSQLQCFHMCTHRDQLSYQQSVQKSKQLCQAPGQITEEVDFVKLQICWNSDQKTIELEPLKFASELALLTLAVHQRGSDVMIIRIPPFLWQATNRVNTVQVISSFK